MWSHNKGAVLVTVKELLKSVLNYWSYPKNKIEYPFFLEHPVSVWHSTDTCLWLSVCRFSVEIKKEEEEDDLAGEVKKRVPLSLEEILAKKKAEEEAQSKVVRWWFCEIKPFTTDFCQHSHEIGFSIVLTCNRHGW